jgi:Domain of unknown function (DUF1995)
MPSLRSTFCLLATINFIDSFSLQSSLPIAFKSTRLELSRHNEDVEKLRQKVASIRAEIAQLEGKTVEEVTKEAMEKERNKSAPKDINNQGTESASSFDRGRMIDVPQDIDSMIFQAARAVEMAYRDGIKRQTVRLALVPEGTSFRELNEWPGGAQQMYREAAKPLTTSLLREIRLSPQQMPPNIIAQDIWDFDGSALLTAEGRESATTDVQALVFPNTDVKYIQDIAAIDESAGDRLFLLINPFWRNIESWGFNLLAPGAKGKAQTTIFDKGYDETYVYLRFSVRGEDCAAIKFYPYDWQIFAYGETDSGWERPIRLGSSKDEPKSEQITELLNQRSEFRLSKTMRRLSR